MKIKNLFLAGLAAVALSACSDDQKDTDLTRNVEGYLSLQITAPKTRTSGSPTEVGEPQESKIDDVTVVLTNASGIVQYVEIPTITNGTTDKFKVNLGTYDVYALVNSPITVNAGDDINTIVETASSVSDVTSGYKAGKFFMVNAFNSNTDVAPNVTITQANTLSNPATAAIAVDRVATKIVDKTDYLTTNPTLTAINSATTTSFIDGVEVLGFAPLNINKQFNLLQKWNANNVLTTPLTLYTPNSDNISTNFFNHIGEYTKLDYDGTVTDSIVKVTDLKSTNFKFDTIYTTENSPEIINLTSKLTSGRGETTAVIYKVQAKKSGSNVGTFYAYKGVVYETLAEIQALADFSSVTLPTTLPELRGYGIQAYEDGIMYYTYFIKDPNTAHQYNSMNYYAVMRNSIYNLTVNSIAGIGDDVPGGSIDPVDPNKPTNPGDPEDPTNPPIDLDQAYIEVTVTVNPWILNNISIDF